MTFSHPKYPLNLSYFAVTLYTPLAKLFNLKVAIPSVTFTYWVAPFTLNNTIPSVTFNFAVITASSPTKKCQMQIQSLK